MVKIFLCGICGCPPNKEIHKTALGATKFVTWEHQENTIHVINNLQKLGNDIISVEQSKKSISLENFKTPQNKNLAFIFGNEVKGVSKEVLKNSDHCIEIPQHGKKKSMNVTICVGVILWHFFLKNN